MASRPTTTVNTQFRGGALALMVALALAAPAAAPAATTGPASASSPTFSLSAAGSAGALRLRGTPGQVLPGAVRLRNLTSHPVTVVLQRADIQNAANGNADFVTTQLSQTGRWLHLEAGTVRLASHAVRQVAFTVSVPVSTRGASHYADIIAIDNADLLAAAGRKTGKKKQSFTIYRINRHALPITIRIPGPLTRSVSLRSVKLTLNPVASLMLGLAPGGTVLIQGATIHLQVLRGTRTIFKYESTLGQLFPNTGLNYRVLWHGTPTPGSYHVLGVFRPQGAPSINIDQTVKFTAANASELKRITPPAPGAPTSSIPGWVWIALVLAAALLAALALAVWRLKRRGPPAAPVV
jgi:hypothetical protein